MELNLQKNNFPERLSKPLHMLYQAIRKIKAEKSEAELEQEELLLALDMAKQELDAAYINFDYAYNKDLVDVFTYQLKAAQANYNYLTKLVKEKICS
jgi:hypothetical protein